MELKSLRVHVVGWTSNPAEQSMVQQAQEIAVFADGFLLDKQAHFDGPRPDVLPRFPRTIAPERSEVNSLTSQVSQHERAC